MTRSQQDSSRDDEFDVVIVGSGAGALTAARQSMPAVLFIRRVA